MPKKTIETKYYHFSQNNSGGSFDIDYDQGISINVIIEATSADEANARAEEIGLYFDGVYGERDCPCCGDRWGRVYEDDGTEEPSIYNKPVSKIEPDIFCSDVYIHHVNGRIEHVVFTKHED